MDTTADVLGRIAGLGPYFALTVGETAPVGGGWRPVAGPYDGGDPLAELIDTAARRLGTGDRRVAGSILHQGYAARLWSVVVGAATAGGVVPELAETGMYWRSTEGSLVELFAAAPRGTPVTGRPVEAVADLARAAVLDRHLDPMARAVRVSTGLSERVLTGNAASSLVGTLRVLAGTDHGAAARDIGATLLAHPPLRAAGTADLTSSPPEYRRASCCLYYRVPGGGLCGDCVLTSR